MTDSTYWLRAYLRALKHDVDRNADMLTALVETLNEVCPGFRKKYLDLLAKQNDLRAEQRSAEGDTFPPSENLPSWSKIETMLEKEAKKNPL